MKLSGRKDLKFNLVLFLVLKSRALYWWLLKGVLSSSLFPCYRDHVTSLIT